MSYKKFLFLSLLCTISCINAEEQSEACRQSQLEKLVERRKKLALSTMQDGINYRYQQLQEFKKYLETEKAKALNGEKLALKDFYISKPNTLNENKEHILFIDASTIEEAILSDIQFGNSEYTTLLLQKAESLVTIFAMHAESNIQTAYTAFLACQKKSSQASEQCYAAFKDAYIPAIRATFINMETGECADNAVFKIIGDITLDEVNEAKQKDAAVH